MVAKNLVVKQDDLNPITTEIIAASVAAIAVGIKKLRMGRLNDKALVLLIVNACPSYGQYKNVTAAQVKAVLSGLECLEREYLKPAKTSTK